MDTRFFGSKEFWITASIAALLVVGGVLATAANLDVGIRNERGCTLQEPAGTDLAADRHEVGPTEESSRVQRVVTYSLEQEQAASMRLLTCTRVGDIEVLPGTPGAVEVRFTITNEGPGAFEAVRDARVEARMVELDGQVTVAGWQASHTRTEGFFDSQSTRVNIEILVPTGAAYDLAATTDVGDITLTGLRFDALELSTDVGDIEGGGLTVAGDVDAKTDVGDIDLSVGAIQSGFWNLRTDVGDVDLRLPPAGTEVGYQVDATADVGAIDLNLGPTESQHHEEDGASAEA